MVQDRFEFSESFTSPARSGFAVVPSDSQELAEVPKALYIGTGGDLVVKLAASSEDLTFRDVPGGAFLSICPEFVRSSGTSASDIIGLV